MRLIRASLPILLLATLAACATDRPLAIACRDFARFRTPIDPVLPVTLSATPAAANALPVSPLAQRFIQKPNGLGSFSADQRHFLVLSGGGQWGAFGAGFLEGWSGSQTHPRPERFDVVTGVSTGALQATFAFLGKPFDAHLIDAYSINSARELVRSRGALFFLHHASMNDISPLETYVRRKLRPLIDEVAADENKRRTLMVGVVDGLDGRMWAVDLTQIARELKNPERESCYAGALIASAAVPIVFRQVTVDGRPYIDGGVRHSVFVSEVSRAASQAVAAEGGIGTVHILMNGDIKPPAVDVLPAKLLPALSRLRSLVFNQIEIASIEGVVHRLPGLTSYLATAAGQSCITKDDTESEVFDPAAMRCLIDFGRSRWTSSDPWLRLNAAAAP